MIPFSHILMFFVQGATFILLLVLCAYMFLRPKSRERRVLGFVLAFWAALHLKDICLISNSLDKHSIEQYIIIVLDTTAIIPCGLLLCELIKPRSVSIKTIVIHTIPLAIIISLFLISHSNIALNTTYAYTLLYSIGISLYTIIYGRHNKLVLQTLSLLLLVYFIWASSYFYISDFSDTIYFIVSCIAWCIISYQIDKKASDKAETDTPQPIVEYDDCPSSDTSTALDQKLQEHIIERKAFLNPHLSITDVARAIGTNRSYLSEHLNNNCNTSFTDYINAQRISYAEMQLRQFPSKPIDDIALESGFNSISTFRRAFIKQYGCTPGLYRKQYYLGRAKNQGGGLIYVNLNQHTLPIPSSYQFVA